MSQVQEVKQATDIIQIIGERVTLQRSGTSWRGLCPFHSEKSPSFFVSDQMQRYKCFGCGESGDVFTFLQKYDGMTFAESLQHLAERAGITLTQTVFTSEDDQRKRVLEILNLAKEYYHFLLTKHALGEPARQYLKNRGVNSESIKLFQMGYALQSWDGLFKYMHEKKKYALADLEAAGLILKGSTGKYYDRFRSRIIFPLTDHRGRVVGFSGRILEGDAKDAKYINSPETMVYHKGQMLFGYSQLYQSIRKEQEVVVVEGEFDVISSAQAHVNNVVGVKGSAFTEDQMKLLSRTVQKVILSFDMDAAGIKATKRAIEVARPFGLEIRVISLPQEFKSKDPDELAKSHPDLWRQAVKSSISVYDFFLQAALKNFDPQTPEGKRKIIDDLAPIFSQITHAVELDYYIEKLAKILEVRPAVVQTDLTRFQQMKRKTVPGKGVVQKNLPTKNEEEVAAPDTRKSRLEMYLLFLLFNGPEELLLVRAEKLKHITFSQVGAKQILTQLLQQQAPVSLAKFSSSLGDDLQQVLMDISTNSEHMNLLENLDIEKEWQKLITELIRLDISEEISRISEELEKLERKQEKTPELEAEQNELLKKIMRLRAKKNFSA